MMMRIDCCYPESTYIKESIWKRLNIVFVSHILVSRTFLAGLVQIQHLKLGHTCLTYLKKDLRKTGYTKWQMFQDSITYWSTKIK